MPRFSEIGDSVTVDNRYAGKVIVYVEDEVDASVFYAITGNDIRQYLEFHAARVGGSGANSVIEQVRAERPSNPKVFGLIDGEAAAALGAVDALLCCGEPFFQIGEPGFDGLIFLAQHEMENLLLLHGDLAGVIERDVELREFGRLNRAEVETRIEKAAQLFFWAALLKYASMTHRHRAQTCRKDACGTIQPGRLLAPKSTTEVLAEIKKDVRDEGLVSWKDLATEVRRTYRLVRARFKNKVPRTKARNLERLRLADGKGVLASLKHRHSPRARWESQLLHSVIQSSSGKPFRARLLTLTRA